MKSFLSFTFLAIVAVLGLTSCADSVEQKPVGPVSETSKMPWNTPVAGQGQFGMMPQNQFRR